MTSVQSAVTDSSRTPVLHESRAIRGTYSFSQQCIRKRPSASSVRWIISHVPVIAQYTFFGSAIVTVMVMVGGLVTVILVYLTRVILSLLRFFGASITCCNSFQRWADDFAHLAFQSPAAVRDAVVIAAVTVYRNIGGAATSSFLLPIGAYIQSRNLAAPLGWKRSGSVPLHNDRLGNVNVSQNFSQILQIFHEATRKGGSASHLPDLITDSAGQVYVLHQLALHYSIHTSPRFWIRLGPSWPVKPKCAASSANILVTIGP